MEEYQALPAFLQGLIIDERVVFGKVDSVILESEADRLLFRLLHSGLHIAVSGVSNRAMKEKEDVLTSLGIFLVQGDFNEDVLAQTTTTWAIDASSCAFVTNETCDLESSLRCQCLVIKVVPGCAKLQVAPNLMTIGSLCQLPYAVAVTNRKASKSEVLLIGHCMKWSREKEFLKRGALPVLPTKNGLSFVPLHLSLPLKEQLQDIKAVLCKATDEIVGFSKTSSGSIIERLIFSEELERLECYIKQNNEVRIIDSIEDVMPLVDRMVTHRILQDLTSIQISGHPRIRVPAVFMANTFDDHRLLDSSELRKIGLPTIVKPQIACGTKEAHIMALVLQERGYRGLKVPLPAVIQEYINHGSCLYKFYLIGNKLFYSTRKSLPDSGHLLSHSRRPAMMFDSLKPLSTFLADQDLFGGEMCGKDSEFEGLDLEAIQAFAKRLQTRLRLTIIGFDIAIQVGTNDYVIVDVNYFPSFKDVPDFEALPSFWEALHCACLSVPLV